MSSSAENSSGAILKSYTAGDLDIATAVQKLTAPVALSFAVGNTDEGTEWMDCMWGEMMNIIRTAAADSSGPQEALVRLLAAIKQVETPPSVAKSEFEGYWGLRLWRDLPILGMAIREDWNNAPTMVPSSPDFSCCFSAEQWASMNAFVARLYAAEVMDFSFYGIWAMRDAFEEPSGKDVLHYFLPAAAMWILLAGRVMYDLAKKAQPPDYVRNASNGGLLWKGPIWYNLERWSFWKQGFHAAMASSELDPWTVEMAARAYHMIGQIEKQQTHCEAVESSSNDS